MMRVFVCLLPLIVVALCNDIVSNSSDKVRNVWASAMNVTVDPCDNFHEYACGGSMLDNHSPLDVIISNWKMDTSVLLKSNVASNSRAVQKARAVYRACTHYTKEAQKRDFINVVKRLHSMYSVKHNEVKMNLTSMLVEMRLLEPPLLEVSVQPDHANKSRRIIKVSQPEYSWITPSSDFLFYKALHPSTFHYIMDTITDRLVNAAKEMGVTLNYNAVRRDIDDVLQFQTILRKLQTDYFGRQRQLTVRRIKLSEFNVLFPFNSFSLSDYLHSIAPSQLHSYLNADPEILVSDVKYFERLAYLLNKAAADVILNYFIVIYADQSLYHDESWPYCTTDTRKILKFAVSALYASKHFDRQYKESGEQIAEAIRRTTMLQEIRFSSEETKKRVVDVVTSMQFEISDAEWIHNTTEVDNFYNELDINETHSFGEMKRIYAAWEAKAMLSQLAVPDVRNQWLRIFPAQYFPMENTVQIAIPAMKEMFSPENPMPVNWSRLGRTIAHEMMHGLHTNEVREIFGNGTDKIYGLFDANAPIRPFQQCLVEQYSSEWIPEISMHLNGLQTLNEDSADNLGIALAFRAFEKNRKTNGSENIDGYSSNQLFFILYAQGFCGREASFALNMIVKLAVHSPLKYRSNLVLRNQKAFADAFQCPVGSPMNPSHKCHFW